jgi:hypothetical protein
MYGTVSSLACSSRYCWSQSNMHNMPFHAHLASSQPWNLFFKQAIRVSCELGSCGSFPPTMHRKRRSLTLFVSRVLWRVAECSCDTCGLSLNNLKEVGRRDSAEPWRLRESYWVLQGLQGSFQLVSIASLSFGLAPKSVEIQTCPDTIR